MIFVLDVHLLNLAKRPLNLASKHFLEIWDRDSVSTLPCIQKSFFWNGNFSENSFLNSSFRECFGKTMPSAFWICYLKSLCIFPNELKLQPKIPQISRKCLEAKFRGRFSQVQQVNVKGKNYGQFPEVFIKLYKKFWAISTIKWRRKKICRKTKKLQFDRVILRPGWNLPYIYIFSMAYPH